MVTASVSRPRKIYGKATLILIHGGAPASARAEIFKRREPLLASFAALAICKFSEIYVKFNIAGTIVRLKIVAFLYAAGLKTDEL